MKRVYCLCLLLLPVLCGCSWMAEMMLFNKSKDTAVVSFRISASHISQEPFVLKAYSITKWNDTVPVLGESTSIYWRMNSDSTIYAELPGNTAMVITQWVNSDLRDKNERLEMCRHISFLKVVYPNDVMFECTGGGCATGSVVLGLSRAGIVVNN